MSEQTPIASTARDESQLVTFYLGNEEFGFDIMSVQEIIRQPQVSRIPLAPAHVEGVANLRGMILPIIDTRTRFGLPRTDDTDRTRVLVVEVDGHKTGLRVDRVSQVTRIARRDTEAPPPVVRQGLSSEFLESVVKLDGGKRIIQVLNARAVCAVAQDLVQARAAAASSATGVTGIKPAGSADDQSITQLVAFKLGREEFAFHMDRVREILRVERPNVVPGTPKHVLGVLTVRGNVLPVIDLRVLLGLSNLESEVVADAADQSTRFQLWLTAAGAAVQSASGRIEATGAEALRQWMADCTTSSGALMQILGRMRTAHDRLTRGLAQTKAAGEPGALPELFAREVAAPARQILELLGEFQRSVKENIREDQRLVVVQTHGSLLALLVDKVREVLNMPKRQIDPAPPRLGDAGNIELSGIAKLENGKRLILLLDADHLINQADLKDLGPTASGTTTNEAQKHQVGGESVTLGEQQFVTFRLGDGEYGVPISQIQEIDRSSKMTRVPRAADYVDGITNLRGEVIPVVNARKRFHLPAKEADESTRVIIMEIGGTKTGLLVDSVREVLKLATRDIAPPPSSLSTAIDQQFISGIGKLDGDKRMVVLLDVGKILQR
jgi:purine-binding chemotaxis protein CheW